MAFALMCGLMGLIVGSFLNVVILRHGAKPLSGRSGCMSCGAQIKWYDLIPVVSWIALKGRCRACHSAISIQYPIVESLTAVSFALVGFTQSVTMALPFMLSIAAFMIVVAAYDIRHTIIPDEWAYMFAFLVIVTDVLGGSTYSGSFLLLLLAGPVSALPLFILWLISGGRWMGLGDAKLALGIGWLLGPVYGPAAIMGAFIIGALISVGILLPLPRIRQMLSKRGIVRLSGAHQGLTMRSEVAFGPFLIASTFLIWILLLYQFPLPL